MAGYSKALRSTFHASEPKALVYIFYLYDIVVMSGKAIFYSKVSHIGSSQGDLWHGTGSRVIGREYAHSMGVRYVRELYVSIWRFARKLKSTSGDMSMRSSQTKFICVQYMQCPNDHKSKGSNIHPKIESPS